MTRKDIEKLCNDVLNEYPDKVNNYKLGKTGLVGFFVGEVLKRSRDDIRVSGKTIINILIPLLNKQIPSKEDFYKYGESLNIKINDLQRLKRLAKIDNNNMFNPQPDCKPQIEHFFKEFTRLANAFFHEGERDLYNYWKGQVMGMSKVVKQVGLDIDTDYWLKQLP